MSSTNVRVDSDTHEQIAELAEERSQSQGEVVRDAVELLRRRQFFREMEASYSELIEDDREKWERYKREMQSVEAETLRDGLPGDGAKSTEP